jgi:hypothetical protein
LHFDVTRTGAKAFSIIVPIILVNDTGPELDLQANGIEDANARVGRLRYQYDVAAMMGDDANHATSAVDYHARKEMRMAATIYVADINEANVDAILEETQNYPPKGRPDILLSMAGKHWSRDDPSVRLPEPICGRDN